MQDHSLELEIALPEPEQESIIPPDQHIELPFPMLVGNKGPILLCAKIHENKVVNVLAVSARDGAILAEAASPLTLPPDGQDIGQHWMTIIKYVAVDVLKVAEARLATAGSAPANTAPLVVPRRDGLVVVGALG